MGDRRREPTNCLFCGRDTRSKCGVCLKCRTGEGGADAAAPPFNPWAAPPPPDDPYHGELPSDDI